LTQLPRRRRRKAASAEERTPKREAVRRLPEEKTGCRKAAGRIREVQAKWKLERDRKAGSATREGSIDSTSDDGKLPRPEGIPTPTRLVREGERVQPVPRKAVQEAARPRGQPLRSRLEENSPKLPPLRGSPRKRERKAHSPPPAPETDPRRLRAAARKPAESAP
jgi:hypothetical protein